MDDLFTTKGTLRVSIGEGCLSSFEASTLKAGDIVRTSRPTGTPAELLFNGMSLCPCEVVILQQSRRASRAPRQRRRSGREIACTQEEIAEAIGVTRETVNRHLGRLQEQGVIRIARGSLRVIAPDELRARL